MTDGLCEMTVEYIKRYMLRVVFPGASEQLMSAETANETFQAETAVYRDSVCWKKTPKM